MLKQFFIQKGQVLSSQKLETILGRINNRKSTTRLSRLAHEAHAAESHKLVMLHFLHACKTASHSFGIHVPKCGLMEAYDPCISRKLLLHNARGLQHLRTGYGGLIGMLIMPLGCVTFKTRQSDLYYDLSCIELLWLLAMA